MEKSSIITIKNKVIEIDQQNAAKIQKPMSFLSSIPAWGWFDIGFNCAVLLSLGGEQDVVAKWLFREKTNDLVPPESLRKKWKRGCEIALIVGIAGEILCLPFSLYGTATAEKGAADAELKAQQLREKADTLEQQITTMQANMQSGFAGLAPSNQPITSLNASITFFVVGTNENVLNEDLLNELRDPRFHMSLEERIILEAELSFVMVDTNRPFLWGHSHSSQKCQPSKISCLVSLRLSSSVNAFHRSFVISNSSKTNSY